MIDCLMIGCGRIGKMHLAIIEHSLPNVRVSHIVDDKLGDSYQGIGVAKNDALETVLNENHFDAIIIAAASSQHVKLLHRVIDYGIPIFCEKPVSFHLAELDVLIEKKAHIQVGLNRRFDPDFIHLKNCIDAGDIGELQLIKVTNRDPKRANFEFAKHSGGLLFDFTIHDFDMINYLAKANVKSVYTQGAVLIDERLSEIGDIDTALISLSFDDDSMALVDASRETNTGYDQRIEVFGSKGMLQVDNSYQHGVKKTHGSSIQSALPLPSFVERYEKSYINQFRSFFDSIDKNKIDVGLLQMRDALALAHACTHSLKTNQPHAL
jgi:myo-inositol 2-dehydrogenase / D-chiro-inositol 1-dehydrogenase